MSPMPPAENMDETALTLQEAAMRLNISYSTIFSYRKELGFQLRARGAWRIWPSRLAAFSEKNNNVTQLSLRVVGDAQCPSAKMKPQVFGKLISASQASPRIRCSSGTTDRQAAQEYHDKLKADLWRQAKLGEQPDRFFEEAAVRCLRLWDGLRDYDSKVRHVAYWRSQFSGRAIRSLKFDEIADKLPTHTTHKHRKPTPVSAATKNRYLATLRRMLKLCEDWDWIDKCPKFSEFVEPDNRVRWEPPSVIGRLISAMTLEWMRDVSLVAVATGMREDELLSLRPSNVDMPQRNAWVIAEEAKSGYARSVPLNADAMAVLQRRDSQSQEVCLRTTIKRWVWCGRSARSMLAACVVRAPRSGLTTFISTTFAIPGPAGTYKPEHHSWS